jgi:hypothetical protein
MPDPRGPENRIHWFLNNNPSKRGMCAQHTWHSLGGNYGNPPAWGAPNANAVIKKVVESGRYFTPNNWEGPPPRGAYIAWQYGQHGHAALSLGDWRIATTDPTGKPGGVGVEPINYPQKWGAKGWTLWTDEYNGVRFPVGEEGNMADGWLSLKETDKIKFRTNKVVKIDINGKTAFKAEIVGRSLLAMYLNIDVPTAGSEGRLALNRGGVRMWFQQYSRTEDDNRDETGYDGPVPIPVWGNQHVLRSHVWPHTVDNDYWEFCFQVYAFDSAGKEVDMELTLQTREIKIIDKL